MGLVIDHWVWWIAAVILMILEVFAPGAIFLWMSISAVLVGLLLLLIPSMGIELQLLLFSVFSVVSVLVWRHYFGKREPLTDAPNLNQRNAQYVGRVFTLEQPIVNGYGKIRVDDSTWKIAGPDAPAGSQVRIVGADGTLLKAEPL